MDAHRGSLSSARGKERVLDFGAVVGLFSKGSGSVDPTTWTYFYPGYPYVDWIACDHYNKTDSPAFTTEADIVSFYAQTVTRGKPLMISETAASNDPAQNPDPQTAWLATIRTPLPSKFPAVRALVSGHPEFRLLERAHPTVARGTDPPVPVWRRSKRWRTIPISVDWWPAASQSRILRGRARIGTRPYSRNNVRNRLVCTRLTGISVCRLSSIFNWKLELNHGTTSRIR